MRDTKAKLSTTTVVLHWAVGLTILFLVVIGIYMHENDAYSLYPIHKSIGIIVFFLVVPRIIWRIINGWPTPVSQYHRWEQILAKVTHWALIISTVALPISGVVMSWAAGYGIDIFSLSIAPHNIDPNDANKIIAINKELSAFGAQMHEVFANVIFFGLILHILGALKHHFIDKDGTLRRMLFARIDD